MTRPILPKTQKALDMLETVHPKYPDRRYTVFEASAKTGTALSTIYYHLNVKPKRKQVKEPK